MTVAKRTRRTPIAEQETAPAAPQESQEAVASTRPVRRVRPAAKEVPTEPVEAVPVKLVDEEQGGDKGPRTDYDKIIRKYREQATTPKKAIRSHCIECMGGLIAEVNRCTSRDCSLYPFRMGKNPFHKLAKGNRADQESDDD